MLNVRGASRKQIMNNAEVKALLQIFGLQYKKTYKTEKELNSMRYGRMMIMADQVGRFMFSREELLSNTLIRTKTDHTSRD